MKRGEFDSVADNGDGISLNSKKYENIAKTRPISIKNSSDGIVLEYSVNGSKAKTLDSDTIGQHNNGWTVSGEISPGYYSWVNAFSAENGDEWVKGDFEEKVECSSLETLEDFLSYFTVRDWDYLDVLHN